MGVGAWTRGTGYVIGAVDWRIAVVEFQARPSGALQAVAAGAVTERTPSSEPKALQSDSRTHDNVCNVCVRAACV